MDFVICLAILFTRSVYNVCWSLHSNHHISRSVSKDFSVRSDFGVTVLDLTFGVLPLFGVEKFSKSDNAGILGVDIHCSYSHSLLSSLVISALYAFGTGSSIPGFVASFSHFIVDWSVHNSDLLLDPFSKVVVGGTGLWGKHPTLTFYIDSVFCVLCALQTPKDKWTLLGDIFLIACHYANDIVAPYTFHAILSMDHTQQGFFQVYLCW